MLRILFKRPEMKGIDVKRYNSDSVYKLIKEAGVEYSHLSPEYIEDLIKRKELERRLVWRSETVEIVENSNDLELHIKKKPTVDLSEWADELSVTVSTPLSSTRPTKKKNSFDNLSFIEEQPSKPLFKEECRVTNQIVFLNEEEVAAMRKSVDSQSAELENSFKKT